MIHFFYIIPVPIVRRVEIVGVATALALLTVAIVFVVALVAVLVNQHGLLGIRARTVLAIVRANFANVDQV